MRPWGLRLTSAALSLALVVAMAGPAAAKGPRWSTFDDADGVTCTFAAGVAPRCSDGLCGGSVLKDGAYLPAGDGAWGTATGLTVTSVAGLNSGWTGWRHVSDGLGVRTRTQAFGTWTGSSEETVLVVEQGDAATTSIVYRSAAATVSLVRLTWATGVASVASGVATATAELIRPVGPNGGAVYALRMQSAGVKGEARRIDIRPSDATSPAAGAIIHYVHHQEAASSTPYLVFDGNSITAGFGVTSPYPDQLVAGLSKPVAAVNFGVSGQKLTEMQADAVRQIDVPGCAAKAASARILVAFGGTNDLTHDGISGEEGFERLRTYAVARRRAGWRVVVVTMLPRSAIADDARRQTFNTLIRANWSQFADALADVAVDPRIGAKGAENDTTYFQADKTHPNNTGMGVIAGIVRPVVQGLLP